MLQLQYIEEPVQDTADLAEFYEQTQMPIALDETIDESVMESHLGGPVVGLGDKAQHVLDALPPRAVAVLVVKPGVVGSFERTHYLAKAATKQDVQVCCFRGQHSTAIMNVAVCDACK